MLKRQVCVHHESDAASKPVMINLDSSYSDDDDSLTDTTSENEDEICLVL